MQLDAFFFAMAVPAVIFAGVSKGGFGSGAAFAATPFLALILGPGEALGLMLPLLMLMDIGALKPYWKKWHWPSAKALLIGSVPGVLLGMALWSVANPDVFRFLIGVIALGFVAWQISQKRGWIRAPERKMGVVGGYIAGLVAGFTSFISHAGGPPAAVYLLSQRLTKTEFQATTVLLFWIVNAMKFVPFAFLGIFTRESLTANLILAPVAFLGVWIGVWAHRAISERAFFGLTYIFLGIAGTKLIWDALT